MPAGGSFAWEIRGYREPEIGHKRVKATRHHIAVREESVFGLARLSVLSWTAFSVLALLSSAGVAQAACPEVGFTWVEPHASPATRPVKIGKNKVIYVRRVPITTTSDIVEIRLVDDDDSDGASLLINFTPAADQRLHDATTNQSGRWLAFMFDDEVMIDSEWEGRYGMDLGGTRVSMQHGLKRGRELMQAIRGCTAANAGDRTH